MAAAKKLPAGKSLIFDLGSALGVVFSSVSEKKIMDVPEESQSQIAKRQAIQAIMRDSSLTPQERQRKIQEFMTSSGPAPPTAAKQFVTPPPPAAATPTPMQSSLRQPEPEGDEQSRPTTTPSTSRQALMQEVMRDPTLTSQEKQQRIQQIMADGKPQQENLSQELSQPEQVVAPLTSKQEMMKAVMQDPSLTPQEKQARIQQIMASPSQNAATPAHESDASPSSQPPASISQNSPVATRRELMQAVMQDPSLDPREKQQRIEQIMASTTQETAAFDDRGHPPPPAPQAPATVPAPEPPRSASRQAMMDVMRDPSLTPQEKQQKIQEIMSGSVQPAAPDIADHERQRTVATVAGASMTDPATQNREAIQAVMRDSALTPQEKQQRVQLIMKNDTPTIQPELIETSATAPGHNHGTEPPSTQQAIQDVMRDASLTPQERQRRVQQLMATGGIGRSSPLSSELRPTSGPSPGQPSTSQHAIQEIMQDPSLEPQEKKKRIQAIMAAENSTATNSQVVSLPSDRAGNAKTVETDALSKSRARASVPASQPGAVHAGEEANADSRAVLSQTERDALIKAQIRAGSIGRPVDSPNSPPTRVSQMEQDVISKAGVEKPHSQTPGAVSSIGTDPASRKSNRGSAVPGALASSGVDPASRKGQRTSTLGSAISDVATADTSASFSDNHFRSPGASASTGVDPASRKSTRPSTRGSAVPDVVEAGTPSSTGSYQHLTPGAVSSTGVDPASRKGPRGSVRGAAAATAASASLGHELTTPGAATSTGVDPANRKSSRASTRGAAEATVAAAVAVARNSVSPGSAASVGMDPTVQKTQEPSNQSSASLAAASMASRNNYAQSHQSQEETDEKRGSNYFHGNHETSEIRRFEGDVLRKSPVVPVDNNALLATAFRGDLDGRSEPSEIRQFEGDILRKGPVVHVDSNTLQTSHDQGAPEYNREDQVRSASSEVPVQPFDAPFRVAPETNTTYPEVVNPEAPTQDVGTYPALDQNTLSGAEQGIQVS